MHGGSVRETLRRIVIAILIVGGLAASIASAESEDPSGGGASSNSDEADSRGEADELDDVRLTSCAVQTGLMTAVVEITNNSPDASDYNIEVAFESRNGARQFGTGFTFVENINNGQSRTADVVSLDDPPGQPFSCRITSVDRTASL